MTFGKDPSVASVYKVNIENARVMVDIAIEAGVNFFDTADGYAGGQSEEILGQVLGKRRHNIVLATKVGFRSGDPVIQAGLSRRHILFSCEQSLKRLGTDYIDLYILHKEDPYTSIEESIRALDDLVRAGKVRYIGFSNWPAWRAATAVQIQKANGLAQFCCGQMNYSLLGRDVEQDVIPFMQYTGIGMTVWSPLAGGFLSGKYTRNNLKDQDNRLSGFDLFPFDKEFGFKVNDRIKILADKHNASVAQIAIAWLLSKPVVSSVILGTSKIHQLEDNLKAIDIKLSKEEIAELDIITRQQLLYPHWFNRNLLDAKHKEIFE